MSGHQHYKLYVHITWHTWCRRGCIRASMLPDFASAIQTAAIRTKVQVLRYAVLAEHVHVLVSLRPETRLSDFVRYTKCISARRVNCRANGVLKWCRGFYAASVDDRGARAVRRYIDRQHERHPHSIPR